MESDVCTLAKEITARGPLATAPVELEVALLTGGFDKPYMFGLAMALVSKGVCLEVIGSDEVDSPEMHGRPNLRFFNLRGSQQTNAPVARKAWRVLAYYARLVRYSTVAKPKTFHILWNNKLQFFDPVQRRFPSLLSTEQLLYCSDERRKLLLSQDDKIVGELNVTVRFRIPWNFSLVEHDNLWTNS